MRLCQRKRLKAVTVTLVALYAVQVIVVLHGRVAEEKAVLDGSGQYRVIVRVMGGASGTGNFIPLFGLISMYAGHAHYVVVVSQAGSCETPVCLDSEGDLSFGSLGLVVENGRLILRNYNPDIYFDVLWTGSLEDGRSQE